MAQQIAVSLARTNFDTPGNFNVEKIKNKKKFRCYVNIKGSGATLT